MLDCSGKLHSLEQLAGKGNKDFSRSSVFKLVREISTMYVVIMFPVIMLLL